jgi:TRAP-type C4-dicarboxylate transport system substrate-binding protein
MKFRIFAFLCIGFWGLIVSPSFVPAALAQAKPVELSYSIFFPAPHKNTVLAGEWAREVEKRSNGAVKITVFPGGTLTPADKCYDGVVKGISDIGMSVFGYTRGKFPLTEVIDLPLGYKQGLAATRLINRYYQQFKPKEFDEVKVLYLHAHGPGILHTKKPVHKLEELKGMRIRSTGLSAKVASALGATPVAMPMGETYDALQRGMVDGSLAPFEALDSTGFFVVMNREKWNALSPEIQKVIEKVDTEWIEKTGMLWDEVDKSGRAFTLKLGNQIISLPKEEDQRWAKAVQSILDDYVNTMKGRGLPGNEALKFCMDYLKKNQ